MPMVTQEKDEVSSYTTYQGRQYLSLATGEVTDFVWVLDEQEEDAIQISHTYILFLAKFWALVRLEQFERNVWIASLEDDLSVFAEGRTQEESISNLIESAREDFEVLSGYEGRMVKRLTDKQKFLTCLFGA